MGEVLANQGIAQMTQGQTVEDLLLLITIEIDVIHMTETDNLMEVVTHPAKVTTITTIIAIIAIIVTYHALPEAIRMVAVVTTEVVMTIQTITVMHAELDQTLWTDSLQTCKE